jgi:hypothetical protein
MVQTSAQERQGTMSSVLDSSHLFLLSHSSGDILEFFLLLFYSAPRIAELSLFWLIDHRPGICEDILHTLDSELELSVEVQHPQALSIAVVYPLVLVHSG